MTRTALFDETSQWFNALSGVLDYYPSTDGRGPGVGVTADTDPSELTALTTQRAALIDQVSIFANTGGTKTVEILGYGGTGPSYTTISKVMLADTFTVVKFERPLFLPAGFRIKTTGLEFGSSGSATINYRRVGASRPV